MILQLNYKTDINKNFFTFHVPISTQNPHNPNTKNLC